MHNVLNMMQIFLDCTRARLHRGQLAAQGSSEAGRPATTRGQAITLRSQNSEFAGRKQPRKAAREDFQRPWEARALAGGLAFSLALGFKPAAGVAAAAPPQTPWRSSMSIRCSAPLRMWLCING